MNSLKVSLNKPFLIGITLIALLVGVSSGQALDTLPSELDAATPSHVLDGKTFVTLEEEPDELVFEDGRFISRICVQWGFVPSPVKTTVEGETVYFTTESISPQHGKMIWQGVVKGDTIEGSYVWTKKRWYWKDAEQRKVFKGILNQL